MSLTREQSILWAKRNLVDMIWKSARLEGLNVTFPQTHAILEQAEVQNLKVHDVVVILNLKNAWQYLLSTLDEPLTLDFLCSLHEEVARNDALEWGTLRTGSVGIGGTNYLPPIPSEEKVEVLLRELTSIENQRERAVETLLKLSKAQLFWDGNKRTAFLVANKLLIEKGLGTLSIPPTEMETFHTLLHNYYEYDEKEELKEYLIGQIATPDLKRTKEIEEQEMELS